MPFKSEKQRRYLWAEHPNIAEAWAHGRHTAKSNHRMPRGKARRGRRRQRRS